MVGLFAVVRQQKFQNETMRNEVSALKSTANDVISKASIILQHKCLIPSTTTKRQTTTVTNELILFNAIL